MYTVHKNPDFVEIQMQFMCLFQKDFDGLTIPELQQDGGSMHKLVEYEMFTGTSGSPNSGKCVDGDYAHLHFETNELGAAFDKASLQRAAVSQESDAMETTTTEEAGVDFEPLRRLTNFGPPKRFHRTFWRSAARRLLNQEQETGVIGIRQRMVCCISLE